jgi:hypothetical protein
MEEAPTKRGWIPPKPKPRPNSGEGVFLCLGVMIYSIYAMV